MEVLTGADVTTVPGTVSNIYRDPTDALNIYYDSSLLANAYLGGLTYNLNGLGTASSYLIRRVFSPSELEASTGSTGKDGADKL